MCTTATGVASRKKAQGRPSQECLLGARVAPRKSLVLYEQGSPLAEQLLLLWYLKVSSSCADSLPFSKVVDASFVARKSTMMLGCLVTLQLANLPTSCFYVAMMTLSMEFRPIGVLSMAVGLVLHAIALTLSVSLFECLLWPPLCGTVEGTGSLGAYRFHLTFSESASSDCLGIWLGVPVYSF